MPLTNVWTRNSNGEWTRTTAMQTDKQYSYSVSAYSHHFRCYNCFQYVTFVKGSSNRISHFKHSAGYSDKDCEDRSFNDNAAYTNASVANMEMPMRLTVDNSQITVSIGLLPINYEELKKCVSSNLLITINGTQSASVVYRADWNRISPNMTTWLNVPTPGISKLKVDFSPANAKPKFWSGVVAEIPATGALFDAKNGRRIYEKGDAVVGHEYYLLLRRGKWMSTSSTDVQITKLDINDSLWNVYRIRALRFSEFASDYFFNTLRVRLTNYPVEMSVLWPPVLEKDTIIETSSRMLKLLLKGEADFSTYPECNSSCTITQLHNNTKLIDIRSSDPLQMVTSERYNRTLQFLYVRSIDRSFYYTDPKVSVSYDDDEPCEDTLLKNVPLRGVLHFLSEDDGYIDVYQDEEFFYRKPLPAGEKTRIIDINCNSRICVFVGHELLSEIVVACPKINSPGSSKLPEWIGRRIPFPRKYAWVLERMDEQSELYERTVLALRQGEIPLDGWNTLRTVMEGMCDVF